MKCSKELLKTEISLLFTRNPEHVEKLFETRLYLMINWMRINETEGLHVHFISFKRVLYYSSIQCFLWNIIFETQLNKNYTSTTTSILYDAGPRFKKHYMSSLIWSS